MNQIAQASAYPAPQRCDDLATVSVRDPLLRSFCGVSGRVGIFGGTFDPVHSGHLAAAEAARQTHSLDLVVFVPTAQNPLKFNLPSASGEARMEMIRLTLQAEEKLFVSPIEIENPGIRYSKDLLQAIRAQCEPAAELFLIVGADCLTEMHKWRDYSELFSLAQVVPVERDGFAQSEISRLNELSLEERETLARNFVPRDRAISSSSAIRMALSRGEEVAELPLEVAEFIRTHDLYTKTEDEK